MKRGRSAQRILGALAFVWLLCVLVFFAHHGSESLPRESLHGFSLQSASLHEHEDAEQAFPSRTLQFALCNGFANQRIGLASGLIFAHLLHRVAVLPDAVATGTQTEDGWNLGQIGDMLPLSAMYDTEYLLKALQQSGLQAVGLTDAAPAGHYHAIQLSDAPDGNILQWLATFAEHAHLRIDCPFLRLPPVEIKAHALHFWAVLDALRPSQALDTLVQRSVSRLHGVAHNDTRNFNFLHLRVENDWLAHCKRWSSIPDGMVRNNCLNNTFELAEHLSSKGVDKQYPLYIASSWEEASGEIVEQVMTKLQSSGYHVVMRPYLFSIYDRLVSQRKFTREQLACVDYYIALKSKQFIGNSVSSFSAMLLLERQRQGAWASYYNGGNIPMSLALPLYRLPWVFTYNSWSSKYNYMLKAAVRSALYHDTFKPYCLFAGNQAAPIVAWMKAHNVTVILAKPDWVGRLAAVLKAHNGSNIAHSHLYANLKMQVGTWQRVDIPTLPILSQYEYVLFTDADVYFRRPVTLDAFQLPLPKTIGMASEAADAFPYNAGVMLMHLPPMRTTHSDFMTFIFNNKHGMYFPAYGPGDQGALNQFYEETVKEGKLPQDFNAKPYHVRSDTAYIVHFHGPKPDDYLTFLRNGTCAEASGDLCKQGVRNSFCFYALEWAKFVQDEDIGQELRMRCSMSSHIFDELRW